MMLSQVSLANQYSLGLAFVGLVACLSRVLTRKGSRLPPGPAGLPLIGNMRDLPHTRAWETYQKWTEAYGDVAYAEALGHKIVVLGSYSAIDELLNRRSAVYSSRPTHTMVNKLMGYETWLVNLMGHSDQWARGRKTMQTHLNPDAAKRWHTLQLAYAHMLVLDVFNAPRDPGILEDQIRTNVGRLIIKLVYGVDVVPSDDGFRDFIERPEEALRRLLEGANPTRWAVDTLPLLQYLPSWFPGAHFQRFARATKDMTDELRNVPIELVKKAMATHTAPPSLARNMLELVSPDNRAALQDIRNVCATVYIAGIDSTISPIMAFFLAMVLYPNVQAKAQAEIDAVVGRDRLPSHSDRDNLPYVKALISELFRWLPAGPMGLPHLAMSDDEYRSFVIPKGATVFPAVWGVLHDPQMYPDPDTFKPERFLNITPEGSYVDNPNVRDPRKIVFGCGRRICVGRYLVENTLFAIIATVLATLDVTRAVGSDGQELPVKLETTDSMVIRPKPFPYDLRPRPGKAMSFLQNSVDGTKMQ